MRASYQDMLDTPTAIVLDDLHMISMENKYSRPREKGKQAHGIAKF
jgi:hypothetical protein